MQIGTRLKLIRKDKGLTQVELSKSANISRSYLGDIENNRYNPSVETIKLIATALNISPRSLFDDELPIVEQGSIIIYEPDEINLINNYRKLDSQGKEALNFIMQNELKRLEKQPKSSQQNISHLYNEVFDKIFRYIETVGYGPVKIINNFNGSTELTDEQLTEISNNFTLLIKNAEEKNTKL